MVGLGPMETAFSPHPWGCNGKQQMTVTGAGLLSTRTQMLEIAPASSQLLPGSHSSVR